MSLSRLALRLAAVEALCPAALASTGPYPTWAGQEVYDSRITPIADNVEWKNFLAKIEGRPLITVYTEDQETTPTSGEYPADLEMVDLVAELMIVAGAIVPVTNPDGSVSDIGSIEAPITDALHEATLDMLEAQVRALLDPGSNISPRPYIQVARELHHVKSVPLRDADRVSRHAARTLTFKLRVNHAQPFGALAAGVAADIAGLPQPLLAVALALDENSASGQLLRQIAKGVPPTPVLTRLDDIRIYSNLDRGVTPTPATADIVSDALLS